MTRPPPRPLHIYGIPAIAWLAITLPSIAQGDYGADSAWYAAIGLQAWRQGELWTLWGPPGQPYFNKPPLAFWIHGLFAWIFGPGVWQARLPTVLAGLACVMLTIRVAASFIAPWSACAAGLVLAFTYEFFRRSFEVSLDVWQLVFLLAACAAAAPMAAPSLDLPMSHQERRRRALAAGACVGLALLCKPLVGLLAIPLIASWIAIQSPTRRAGVAAALMLAGALMIALPWHASMWALHGDFAAQYFGAEVAARAAGEITASPQWSKPWWFYLAQLVETGWPWLALSALAIVDLAAGKLRPSARPLARVAIVWFVGWLILLTLFPDRRDRYAVVLHPALAILSACWLDSKAMFVDRAALWARMAGAGAVVAGGGLLIAVLAGAKIHRRVDPQWPALFARLRTTDAPGLAGPTTSQAPRARLWAAGLAADRAARIYLEFGQWPSPTRNRWNKLVIDPALAMRADDWLIYHRRDGWRPGPGEVVIWQERDLTITTLETGAAWSPISASDPGE